MISGPVAGDVFVRRVGTKHRRAAARAVLVIHAHLHGDGIRAVHTGLSGEHAAEVLQVSEARVEVESGDVLPRVVAAEGNVVVRRIRRATPVTAVAHADEVMRGRSRAIDADEGGVHLRVRSLQRALARDDGKLGALVFGHDDFVERLRAGIGRIIDLIERVRDLTGRSAAIVGGSNGRRGPCAGFAGLIRGLNIELDDGTVGLRGQNGAVKAVVGRRVTTQTVIAHDGAVEGRWRGGIDAMEQGDGNAARRFVHDSGGDHDAISGPRNDRQMRRTENHRREVVREDGIRASGRALRGAAGSPVLALVV